MKKYISILLLLTQTIVTIAQNNENALSFSLGGGQNQLSYKTVNGVEKEGYGWNADLSYHLYLSSRIGMKAGIAIQSYTSSSVLNFTEETSDVDSEADDYIFRAKFSNWQEQQQLINIELPVTVLYLFPINDQFHLQTSVGVKICLPISSTYQTTNGSITTSAYYPRWNVELNDLPQYGYDTYTNMYKGTNNTTIGFIGVAQIGGIYKLTEKFDLYTGLYCDYGLNNMLKSVNQNLYLKTAVYNGIFNANQTKVMKPIALGFKVGINYKLNHRMH
jgi:hypothetical protein